MQTTPTHSGYDDEDYSLAIHYAYNLLALDHAHNSFTTPGTYNSGPMNSHYGGLTTPGDHNTGPLNDYNDHDVLDVNGNCERLDYPNHEEKQSRKRCKTACIACRVPKARCTGDLGDGSACARCQRLGKTCEFVRRGAEPIVLESVSSDVFNIRPHLPQATATTFQWNHAPAQDHLLGQYNSHFGHPETDHTPLTNAGQLLSIQAHFAVVTGSVSTNSDMHNGRNSSCLNNELLLGTNHSSTQTVIQSDAAFDETTPDIAA